MNSQQLSLYLVTDRTLSKSKNLSWVVEEAVKGGVTMVQLREKNIETKDFIGLAVRLKKILKPYGVPLIINDRIDVALASDADGVHIGQSDMDFHTARKILGRDRIIGLSIENFGQLAKANEMDVDYVAASPVFATPTKTDTSAPWGIEGLKEFVKKSKHPVVAIGGINCHTAQSVTDCGVDGLAVVSAIVSADNPMAAATELKKLCPVGMSLDKSPVYQKTIGELGEFGLIDKIKEFVTVPDGVQGIGDDCAIIPQTSGKETLVSTDMLVEDIHFIRNDINPYDLGWKSAAVNISDIAAMGGKPVASFLSLSLPPDIECKWIGKFIKGYTKCCKQYNAPLLGGDTTASRDKICINVTVIGECDIGCEKKRSTAEVGDLICVTGNLGDSAGGLSVILGNGNRKPEELALIEKHYRPYPRVEEGIALAATDGVHAMMDISDGIASDLRHILKASRVGAEIDFDKIPVSDELNNVCKEQARILAVEGGEDYELLFTISPEAERNLSIRHFVIGKIIKNHSNDIIWDGSVNDFQGFKHF